MKAEIKHSLLRTHPNPNYLILQGGQRCGPLRHGNYIGSQSEGLAILDERH